MYHYSAFGIHIISEVELPALLPVNGQQTDPVHVKIGIITDKPLKDGIQADRCTYCNEHEMIYTVEGKIKFHISNGKKIIIQPITPDYQLNLIYFYSNCLAAILYQRNMIPFHVSGVFTGHDKVALFAAPSGTGKSTLAIKLHEFGYKIFTDDTAVLSIENGRCYAQASYPMIRLWQNTLNEQSTLQESDKQQLYEKDELDKYGFLFHKTFISNPVEVSKIIFLKKEGNLIEMKPIKQINAFTELSDNVYRCHWITAMKKNRLQFMLISQVLQFVPNLLAIRPEENTYEAFSSAIKKELERD